MPDFLITSSSTLNLRSLNLSCVEWASPIDIGNKAASSWWALPTLQFLQNDEQGMTNIEVWPSELCDSTFNKQPVWIQRRSFSHCSFDWTHIFLSNHWLLPQPQSLFSLPAYAKGVELLAQDNWQEIAFCDLGTLGTVSVSWAICPIRKTKLSRSTLSSTIPRFSMPLAITWCKVPGHQAWPVSAYHLLPISYLLIPLLHLFNLVNNVIYSWRCVEWQSAHIAFQLCPAFVQCSQSSGPLTS